MATPLALASDPLETTLAAVLTLLPIPPLVSSPSGDDLLQLEAPNPNALVEVDVRTPLTF
jgi:hypothetical protein